MKTSLLHKIVYGTLALGWLSAIAPAAAPVPTEKPAPPERPLVQIALLLDTSGSMGGLISQAKQQLWQIVNEFIAARQDGVAPRVEVALYQYGNDQLPSENGWIEQLSPLTQDLDQVSEKLFALGTSGGDEYCGWVIREAVEKLAWDRSTKVYKAIFIAGNEPFTQGPVNFGPVCKTAIARDIIINTIHCGTEADGIQGGWKDGATLADGRFLTINHNAQVANITAPQDREIAEVNAKLNATYIAFGAHGVEGKRRQEAQDLNAAQAPAAPSVVAARAKTKASANYANASWDLIDALQEKEIALKDLKG